MEVTIFIIIITISVIAIGFYFVKQDEKIQEKEK